MLFLDGLYECDCISRLMRKIFDHVFTSKNASNKLIEENRGKYAWISYLERSVWARLGWDVFYIDQMTDRIFSWIDSSVELDPFREDKENGNILGIL